MSKKKKKKNRQTSGRTSSSFYRCPDSSFLGRPFSKLEGRTTGGTVDLITRAVITAENIDGPQTSSIGKPAPTVAEAEVVALVALKLTSLERVSFTKPIMASISPVSFIPRVSRMWVEVEIEVDALPKASWDGRREKTGCNAVSPGDRIANKRLASESGKQLTRCHSSAQYSRQ
jgi:hypothetical protein